jgi:hypothetical protein
VLVLATHGCAIRSTNCSPARERRKPPSRERVTRCAWGVGRGQRVGQWKALSDSARQQFLWPHPGESRDGVGDGPNKAGDVQQGTCMRRE